MENFFEEFTRILEDRTILGNPNLLQERGLVDNRPFDPLIWFESNFSISGISGEYLGPSSVEDLRLYTDFLEERIGRNELLAGLDPIAGNEAAVTWSLASLAVAIREVAIPSLVVAILGRLSAGTIERFNAQLQVTNSTIDFINEVEPDECFPAHTSITLPDQTTKPISEIKIGDRILSYNKNGNLVEGIVDKLFRNTTQEWINLSFNDGRDDLTATPGHRFLTETGDFMEIGHMVRLGGGSVRLVEKDGSIVEARGELISYSAETAHLFEEAQSRATIFDGNLAVKHDAEAGWATYNFEVRETHTYIADNVSPNADFPLAA